MAEQVENASSVVPFDYELLEGDPDELRTVNSSPAPQKAYIDPASLKLRHRIGRGVFGDVWVATHHQTASDFDEYHEVVIKMLNPIKEDFMNEFLRKFEALWVNLRSPQLGFVCWLHGVSVISGQICIAMKSYEGSIGDQIALRKGGKLSLADVLRYGIELATGIQNLHQRGILVLNLKPTNFLLDENDHIVLCDFGIPYLFLGIPLLDSRLETRLGTPNYMAPEQWEPHVKGPISYETDSWGFACSIIEMVSGFPPWFARSVDEIHQAIVMFKEKPMVPSGLPLALEQVLKGCFEYDLRNRPTIRDILAAFESSQNALYEEDNSLIRYNTLFLSKNDLQINDKVRSKKGFNGHHGLEITEGVVVGLEKENGRVIVKSPSSKHPIKLNARALERVIFGFTSGIWVRLVNKTDHHSSTGILHNIQHDGSVSVGFLGHVTLWKGHFSEIEVTKAFSIGEFVRLKGDINKAQFEWPYIKGSGRISHVFPNGCLLVSFPGRFVIGEKQSCFLANPDEVEHICFGKCNGIIEKFKFIEDFHWAIRPLVIAFGVVMVAKIAGKRVSKGRRESNEERKSSSSSSSGSGSGWLPPKVANILFNEGV